MAICLQRGANDLHMVQLRPLPPHHLLLQQNLEWFILLVPAYPGCPGIKAVKRLCVSVLYGSETWSITKKLERTLERTEIRMVRWLCGKRLHDRVPSAELRDRLGTENISTVLQRNRLT